MTAPDYTLAAALETATLEDVEFAEAAIQAHPDWAGHKVGFRPTSVKGVVLPDSTIVVFVRATDSRGSCWYVLDRSKQSCQHAAEETVLLSELEAKSLVLAILKRTYQASGT